jgi:uncharacterized protein YaiL (DUF2058 family)
MMNLAQDVRIMIRKMRDDMTRAIRIMLDQDPNVSFSAIDAMVHDPGACNEILRSTVQQHVVCDDADATRLRAVLRKLEDFGYTTRSALTKVGVPDHIVESTVILLKNTGDISKAWFDAVYPQLTDLLEAEREIETAEKEAKRRARESIEDHRVEAVDPEQAKFDTDVSSVKSNMNNNLSTIQEKMGQLGNLLKSFSSIINSSRFPRYPTDRIQRQSARIIELERQLSDKQTETAAQAARIDELQAIIERMQTEKAAAEQLMSEAAGGGEWRVSMDRLITKLQHVLSRDDFIGAAQGLASARTILTDAQKAVAAGAAPTVV